MDKMTFNIPEGCTSGSIQEVDNKIVISFNEKWEPKDGDFVFVKDNDCDDVYVFIFSHIDPSAELNNVFYHAMISDEIYINSRIANLERWNIARLATESERQQLIDKLASEGYEWDADKKEVVKLKWKPNRGDTYYIADPTEVGFWGSLGWDNSCCDIRLFDRGLVFKTPEGAISKCKQMLGIDE